MAIIRTTTRSDGDVRHAVNTLTAFKTSGSFEGGTDVPSSPGHLAGEEREAYMRNRARIAYVILSYWTPIAWVYDDDTRYVVKQRFSATTSKHQSTVRRAFA